MKFTAEPSATVWPYRSFKGQKAQTTWLNHEERQGRRSLISRAHSISLA